MGHLIQAGAIAFALLLALLPVTARPEESVGEKFRKIISEIDARCKREKRGPYSDRTDPEYRKKVADTSCDISALEPHDWREMKMVKLASQPYPVPEAWLSTPEARFAHSIVLPDSEKRPANIYQPGMAGSQYFEQLCEKEAGEFVYRTVSGVQGVLQGRPWLPAPSGYRDLIFWVTEKGGLHAAEDYLVQPPLGIYQFLEVRLSKVDSEKNGAPFRVFYRDGEQKRNFVANLGDGKFERVPYIVANAVRQKSQAQYAFTWRGISPPEGVQHGIEGIELIAYKTSPFEVLAYQRDFRRHLPDESQRDARITYAVACSQRRGMKAPHKFIEEVLVAGEHP